MAFNKKGITIGYYWLRDSKSGGESEEQRLSDAKNLQLAKFGGSAEIKINSINGRKYLRHSAPWLIRTETLLRNLLGLREKMFLFRPQSDVQQMSKGEVESLLDTQMRNMREQVCNTCALKLIFFNFEREIEKQKNVGSYLTSDLTFKEK